MKKREIRDNFNKPIAKKEICSGKSETVTIGYVPLKEKIKRLGKMNLDVNGIKSDEEGDPEKLIKDMSVLEKRNFDLSDTDEILKRVDDLVKKSGEAKAKEKKKLEKDFKAFMEEKLKKEKEQKEKKDETRNGKEKTE